jgi:hypothetical protein
MQKTSHRNTDYCIADQSCEYVIFVLGIFHNAVKIEIKIKDYVDNFVFAKDSKGNDVLWSIIGVICHAVAKATSGHYWTWRRNG